MVQGNAISGPDSSCYKRHLEPASSAATQHNAGLNMHARLHSKFDAILVYECARSGIRIDMFRIDMWVQDEYTCAGNSQDVDVIQVASTRLPEVGC